MRRRRSTQPASGSDRKPRRTKQDRQQIAEVLQPAIQALSDAFGVGLVVIDNKSDLIVPMQHPRIASTNVVSTTDFEDLTTDGRGDESLIVLREGGKQGPRRFVVSFRDAHERPIYVCSAEIFSGFPWIDGQLTAQVVPDTPFPMETNPRFLLRSLIAKVCRTLLRQVSEGSRLLVTERDKENIRRIVLSIRRKIKPELAKDEMIGSSLDGIPGLDAFSPPKTLNSRSEPEDSDLSDIFKLVTSGSVGSVNLMSLCGDVIIKPRRFANVCNLLRQTRGVECFLSDVECLIEAALGDPQHTSGSICRTKQCYAHFSELFAPVFVEGLIVGLLFSGQLIETIDQEQAIQKSLSEQEKRVFQDEVDHLRSDPPTFSKTKPLVAALAALIGIWFDRFCAARNEAKLLASLVDLPVAGETELFLHVCEAVRRSLPLTECSYFRADAGRLLLVATTARNIWVRDIPGGPVRCVSRDDALGKVFYNIGDGLTGSAVFSEEPLYHSEPRKSPKWTGRCSEIENAAQCLVSRVENPDGGVFGVLRGGRPGDFSPLSDGHRVIFGHFSTQLGALIRSNELREAGAREFRRRADDLQDLLAEAAHEFQGPMHCVLSLITALPYTATKAELADLNQRITEEIYRAKRNTENYLLRGIEGKEAIRYDFRLSPIGKLLDECASRFIHIATKKGVRIVVGPEVTGMPEIHADRARLDQVFSNLIENAIKYGFDNSSVEINAKEKTQTVVFSIKDFGLGIPMKYRVEIFKGYQRTVEDQSRFKPGTGLGLSIAKRIVEAHGGEIQVESTPQFSDHRRLVKNEGYNTVFRISLPKCRSNVNRI